ncbi:MAG: hypothetical protein SFV32_02640 [Opitutaceae bacterium]|nr:hypothetical protein [Opitutaceae bacterium]
MVEVINRDLDLRADRVSTPSVSLTPPASSVTLGASVTLVPSIADGSQVSASMFTGGGMSVANPSGGVAVTPASLGEALYTFQATGWVRLRRGLSLGTFKAMTLHQPDGSTVDMLGTYDTVVSQTGSYFLRAEDTLGNVVDSEPVSVTVPTASAQASVRVRLPRVIHFGDRAITFGDVLTLAATSDGDGTPAYSLLSGPATLSGDQLRTTSAGLARVQVSYPETARYEAKTAEATVRIAPRIVAFTAEDPASPSASLVPAAVPAIVLGDSFALDVLASGGESRLWGNGIDVLNPAGSVRITPSTTGSHVYRLRVSARPVGTLRWVVEGATRVEIEGASRSGNEWTDAPVGRHRLRAVGTDEVDAWSDWVTITAPTPAEAEASVAVRPRILSFETFNPPIPEATLRVDPASGWVNPAAVNVEWRSRNAARVTVNGDGRGLAFARTDAAGSETLRLSPGPKRFHMTAEAGPATITWETRGASRVTLHHPDGRVEDVDPASGSASVYSGGEYTLSAVGNDTLETRSAPALVVIPSPADASVSGVVDVTLLVEAGSGGRATGGRVVPFGSVASFSAEAGRGHHFARWTGEFSGESETGTMVMENDARVRAEFAPNRYLITGIVVPEGAGTISGGGAYFFGTDASLLATPGRHYRFARWSGAAAAGPPLTVPVDGDATYTAEFERMQYRLGVKMEGAGAGTVSPGGGMRLAGEEVAVRAEPDGRSRLVAWGGDAGGAAPVIVIRMEGDRTVVARFEPKLAQTIRLAPPPDEEPGRQAPVDASSSSGLPVTVVVASGPGEVRGGSIFVTGTGPITVRATQPGDSLYLPADPVEVTFMGVAPPMITFREAGADALVQDSENRHPNRTVNE